MKVKLSFDGDAIFDIDEEEIPLYMTGISDCISDTLGTDLLGHEINVRVNLSNKSAVD